VVYYYIWYIQDYNTSQFSQLIANETFYIEVKSIDQGVYVLLWYLLLLVATVDMLVVDMYTEVGNTSVASLLEDSERESPLPGDVIIVTVCLAINGLPLPQQC